MSPESRYQTEYLYEAARVYLFCVCFIPQPTLLLIVGVSKPPLCKLKTEMRLDLVYFASFTCRLHVEHLR